jgi:flagellar motility protein MotE (MotC chaperone)
MIRTLQSSWLAALVGCLLYLGVTLALIKPSQFQGLPGVQQQIASRHDRFDEASWRFRNPEFDQWVQEVKREKESLAVREQQLRELQTRLESERQELNTVTQAIYQLQNEFDKNVIRIKDQEVENLKRQAKVMSGMSPEGAANLINQMPDEDAVRILYTMKTDEASVILDTLGKLGKNEARRAAMVAELMRHTLPPASGGRSKTSP